MFFGAFNQPQKWGKKPCCFVHWNKKLTRRKESKEWILETKRRLYCALPLSLSLSHTHTHTHRERETIVFTRNGEGTT